jgi:isoleucyl-tRNA synthetase
MYLILSAMTRLLAPILAFTADEVWKAMPHSSEDNVEHVLLNDMPDYNEALGFDAVEEHYDRLFDVRDSVMKALELARAEKLIGKSLEAKVEIYTEDDATYELLSSFGEELKVMFIVSDVKLAHTAAPEGIFSDEESKIAVSVCVADGKMCDRCWMHSELGVETEDGFICERCASVLGK